MHRSITAVVVALAIVAPNVAHAAKKRKSASPAPPCVSEAYMPSLDAYTLKTELMTAALSCGPDARQQYNQFVVLREADLTRHGGQLKKGLGKKTNNFVTEVANKTGGQLNCEEAAGHFERVLSPEMTPLENVATTEWAQPRHGYQVCPVKVAKKGKKK